MKTLIKKNLYFNNTFDAEAHHNVSSKFMGNMGVNGGGASGGGPAAGTSDDIEYFNIGTTGNTLDWGGELLNSNLFNMGAGGDGHKGILSVGGGSTTDMEMISFTTKGSVIDYGELSSTVNNGQGCSNGHRGMWYDGNAGPKANIYYVDFGSRGTAADFGGDRAAGYGGACASNGVRAVWQGGHPASNDVIDYVNMGVSGANSTDFGECVVDEHYKTGTSNGHRGVYMAGGADDSMEYVTIGTTGVGIDFGDLHAQCVMPSVVSDGSRGVCINGFGTESPMKMDYINLGGPGGKTAFFGEATRRAYSTSAMSGN